MKKRLEEIKIEARRAIKAVTDETRLSRVKAKFVGRKGQITALLKQMRDVPDDEKPAFGQMINEVKDVIEAWIEARSGELREEKKKRRLTEERIDITIPGRRTPLGGGHPVTLMMEEVVRVFMNMGFEVAEGPEVELDYYNFEALNIPKDHPARDMQDTFYISDEVVLRTHTSPVQIRVMEKRKPPVKIIAPGKVYRCDSDVSHTPMFHQVEGLLVDSGVSFGDLKGVLREFVSGVFGRGVGVRFRPSFFPFTEPSAEVDIECVFCKGGGCRICKQTGWLEILGCGMVDPAVFESVNYDSEQYCGFAFGLGIERVAMLKYGVGDIRLFFENDVRFLRQFRGRT
ncbi:MAG: phenylalanine--tRNA ligase subunit alpha [Candidatus Dadabacteria bacterium]|nr:phenylalanine--tRNA ligase subunit alpha [Candidatus Dadabacteria bacterium]